MPHLFVNRLRKYSLAGAPDDLRNQFKWEVINAVCYETGGIIFIAGSVLFLPKHEEYVDMGSWLFIWGSVLYLFVSGHDLYEVFHSPQPKFLDALAASSYITGGVVFIIGSYLFLPSVGAFTAGAYNFIFGSILFICGAVYNSIQIFDSPTRESALYANLTAVCYVIGSTLFLSGSVPYIWDFESETDSKIVYRYLGIQFILGSLLFFIGGTVNIWRAYLIFKDEFDKHEQEVENEASCIDLDYNVCV